MKEYSKNVQEIFILKYFILIIFAFYIDYSHPHANVGVFRVDHKKWNLLLRKSHIRLFKKSCDHYNNHKTFSTVSGDN